MPRLSESTVQAVRDLPLTQVLAPYLTLKPRGGKATACCPFHNEKTASFTVDERRGFFRCFGCAAAGDGIGFVMKRNGLNFADAIVEIASQQGVEVEYEKATGTPEEQAEAARRHDEQVSIRLALTWAAGWFGGNELPKGWAKSRGLDPATVAAAGLGFAPAGGNNLLTVAVQQGYSLPVLVAAGLIKEREKQPGTYYDAFRERVMFPIRDRHGNVVAFTGRYAGPDVEAEKLQPPKYINSPDSAWTKGQHLYGLDTALASIAKVKPAFVYCVEGQIDVWQVRQAGAPNTVAVGGTALTDAQIKLLGRYCQRVVLVPDNDAAGLKALNRQAEQLLAAGFDVRVLVPDTPGADPDSYLRSIKTPSERLAWLEGPRDYLGSYLPADLMQDEALGPVEQAAAVNHLGALLETLPDVVLRDTYYAEICKLWKPLKRYTLQRRAVDKAPRPVAVVADRPATTDELAEMEAEMRDLKASHDYGFFERNNAYYKYDSKGVPQKITNYTIKLLYFVRAGQQSRAVCQFSNEFREVQKTVLLTDEFIKVESLDKCAARLGNFVFFGQKLDLDRMRVKLLANVPYAREVERLGRHKVGLQNDGFYAWANGIHYHGEFFAADRDGFVRLRRPVADVEEIYKMRSESKLEIEGTVRQLNAPDEIFKALAEEAVAQLVADDQVFEILHWYLPAAADLLAGSGNDDDTLNKFRHFGTGKLRFTQWAKQIEFAYGQANGRTMVAFYVAALFRTVIYRENNGYFPLLYHYGAPLSGKSTAARSLARMFGIPFDMDGTGLESGSTQIGISRMLGSVQGHHLAERIQEHAATQAHWHPQSHCGRGRSAQGCEHQRQRNQSNPRPLHGHDFGPGPAHD